jgi:hypothetical protein
MLLKALADAVLFVHFAFVLVAVAGGLAVLKWPRFAWVHVPLVIWASLVNLMTWTCPLTPLENSLRQAAGDAGYSGGFIEHYLGLIVYPPIMTHSVALYAGAAVALWNVVIYAAVIWLRRSNATAAGTNRQTPRCDA